MNDELYQEQILDHCRHPRNAGRLEDATHCRREVNPGCGDSIELFLLTNDKGRIARAAFVGSGCAISQAAASMLSERLAGKTLVESAELTEDDVDAMLGVRVAPQRRPCAMLALKALMKIAHSSICHS